VDDDAVFAQAGANLRQLSQYYRAVVGRGLDLVIQRN
jgi:hypothetical protein